MRAWKNGKEAAGQPAKVADGYQLVSRGVIDPPSPVQLIVTRQLPLLASKLYARVNY